MAKNDDGTLSFGTAIDVSGFEDGMQQIENKVSELTSSVESETTRISEMLSNVPTLNIDVVTNASSSLTTIDTAYAELDRVIDTNRSSVLALEEEYKRLGTEMADIGRKAATPAIQAEYDALKQQRTAITENINLRKKIVAEAEKVGDSLYETELRLKKEAAAAEKSANSQVSLRTRLRQLREELVMMEASGQRGTAQYRALQEEAGKLTDAWADATAQATILAHDQRGMQGIISGLSGVTGAFTVAQGAVSLFAGENEDLQKIMLKVQSLMAITIGLQQIQQTLNKDSAFTLVTLNSLKEWWNKITGQSTAEQTAEATATQASTAAQIANTTATAADTAAQTTNNAATKGGTAAQVAKTAATKTATSATIAGTIATKAASAALKGLKYALISTGIGALIVLVGELVSWVTSLFDATSKADKEFEEQQEILKAGNEAYIKASMEIGNYITQLENFNGTQEQEKQFIKDLNSEFGKSMGYHKTLAEWKAVLTQKGQKYCEMLRLEAEAQALLTKTTEAYINLKEIEAKADNGDFNKWWRGKRGDDRAAQKMKDEARQAYKQWKKEWEKIQSQVQQIKDENDFNFHIDPSTTGKTFDPKKAAAAQKKAVEEWKKAVKQSIREAHKDIEDYVIESMAEGLDKEIAQINLNTAREIQAWQDQFRQLAETRKETAKKLYLSQNGATESGWENSTAGKMSIDEWLETVFKETPAIKENYDAIFGAIFDSGEKAIAESRKKYADALVEEFGTTSQKIDLIRRNWEEKIKHIPTEYADEAIRKMNEEIASIGAEGFKKSLNWEEVFGNLDRVATSSLESIKAKLSEFVKSQNDLSPEALKEIVEAIEKIDDNLTGRDPFTAMIADFATLKQATNEVKAAQQAYNEVLEDGMDEEKKNAAATLEAARNAKQKALAEATKSLSAGVDKAQEMLGIATSITGTLESFGVDIPKQLSGFIGGMGDMLDGLGSINLTNPVSIISGTVKAIGGLGKAIASLFNDDAKHEKRIQQMQKQIDALGDSYDRLTDKVEKLYSKDASKLIEDQNKLLEQQKVLIQNQIREEQSKKDTDNGRIEEWRKQIEEIDDLISENKEKAVDAIFGEDLKSAIDDFASAYADAWSSGTDRAKTAKDQVRDMMRQMVTESIKAAIESSDAMERIRQKLQEFYADNVLSGWEQNYIYNMAEQLQKQLDSQFGWADSLFTDPDAEREGTSKGIATASQDSVDENNARLTTIQGHTYTLVQGLNDLNQTSNAILAHVAGIHDDTESMDKKLDGLGKIEQRTRRIENAIEDINTKGLKLR